MENKYYLATTAQDFLWDTDKSIIFLGEWCRVYDKRSFWKSLDGRVLDNAFCDVESTHEAYVYVKGVYEVVLPILAVVLNQMHGKQHSLRYWRILLGPWLQTYLTATYDRYEHITRALHQFPSLTTTTLSEDSFVTPVDTLAYVSNLFEDSFNLQVYSKILRFLGKSFPKVSIESEENSLYCRLTRSSWKHKVINKISKLYIFILSKVSPVSVVFRSTYFPHAFEFYLLRKLIGKIFLMKAQNAIKIECKYDISIRNAIKKPFGEDIFLKCLSEMLYSDIPMCFVEGYQAAYEAGNREYPRSVKVVFSANSWYYDEAFKSWAAESSEKGAILLGTPHGGGYGAVLDFFGEEHESSIVDYYYSWGWTGSLGKVVPMPASKLTNIKEIVASNSKQGVLWVTTSSPRYLIEFNDAPSMFQNYLSGQKKFLGALSNDFLSEISLRAHYQDNGWGLIPRLKEIEPSLKLDSWDVPFLESLEKCRLYVCDHLSTTFTEALASNKPTILFWDRDNNRLKPEAEPYFDLLRDAGILFDQPEAAAEAVQYAYADVELWWNDVDRQQAVKVFCNQFARTSPDAIELWEKELRRVLLEAERSCST